ncbi:ATP-dependent DNA helicase pif1 [Campylobacterota bacterium]|nr:ATP-dependent DNA helicase pif1 [Campylobacterota bacterium]
MIDIAALTNDTTPLFITGGAGVGKSYLLCEIAARMGARGKKVALLASTGIAAINIGGSTVHRFFMFGVSKNQDELSQHDSKSFNKKRLPELLKALAKLDLIAIDEVSMVSADLMEMIGARLMQAGFCGKIVLCGDFYQLPPVRKTDEKPSGDLFTGGGFYAFESWFWQSLRLKVVELVEPKRTDDRKFVGFLNNLRRGVLSDDDERLLGHYATQESVLSLDPTHLVSTNEEADAINGRRVAALDGVERRFEAEMELGKGVDERVAAGFIKSLTTPMTLVLKIGARVLFTINKYGEESYYNGERGEVTAINEDAIVVAKQNGKLVEVERHDFELSEINRADEKNETVLVRFSQFPLRLAWAITIHKSQGMSLSPLAVNVDRLFEAGQLYVALSRSNNPKQLFLRASGDPVSRAKRAIRANPTVDRFYGSVLGGAN